MRILRAVEERKERVLRAVEERKERILRVVEGRQQRRSARVEPLLPCRVVRAFPLRSLGLVAVVALGSVACSVYDPALLTTDAAVARDLGVRRDLGTTCTTCPAGRPPPRPASPDGNGPEAFYALRNIQIVQDGNRWKTIGYDLDGLDTQDVSDPVECTPGMGRDPETDGEGGVDNAFGHLITPLLLAADPEIEREGQANETAGLGAVLLRVIDWNGGPDDARVHVTVTQSVFGTPKVGGAIPDAGVPDGGVDYDAGVPPLPRWDGNDAWWGRSDSFFGGDESRPRIFDDNAYVANGTIVMRLPDRRDVIFSGNERGVLFKLTDATLTAHMTSDGSTVDRALLSGRWSANDILDAIPFAGVCPGSPNYRLLENLLTTSVDVRSTPGSGGAGVSCDALSVGLAFDGTRATWAGTADGFTLENRCR